MRELQDVALMGATTIDNLTDALEAAAKCFPKYVDAQFATVIKSARDQSATLRQIAESAGKEMK